MEENGVNESGQRASEIGIVRSNSKEAEKYDLSFKKIRSPIFSTVIHFSRPILKRQAVDNLSTADCKKIRLDDISEETVAQILQVINDPKKMLGPEVCRERYSSVHLKAYS